MATAIPRVNRRMLKKMRAETLELHARCRQAGRKLSKYTCPKCQKEIETLRPLKRHLGGREFWGGVKACIECGALSIVRVFANGKTEVDEI